MSALMLLFQPDRALTQVTDLTHPDGFVVSEPRMDSNSADDFLEVVMLLLLRGVLRAGDFLICDNAPIHFSDDIEAALEAVLAVSQVCCFYLSGARYG